MQDTPAPASEAAEAAVTRVRDAITGLRAALDQLEAALGEMSSPTAVETDSGVWAASASVEHPASERSSESSGWASPREDDQASEPAAKAAGGWGDWSASPSLRDGGWPVAAGNAGESQPVERTEDEDVRDQVRRAVEQLKAELGPSATSDFERPSVEEDTAWDAEPADPVAGFEPESVVQEPPAWEASAPEAAVSDAAVYEASVAQDAVVAEAAEVEAAEPETAPQDEGDIREKVRRAVMDARAELGSGTVESDFATPAASPLEARIPHYEALLDKSFLSPACIVIEDPEGRVELVRVYRTLARLERAATANLANYSSHSVTIQMEERELPAPDDISDAVAYAFERSCKVDVDGNRANVLLTGSDTRAA